MNATSHAINPASSAAPAEQPVAGTPPRHVGVPPRAGWLVVARK